MASTMTQQPASARLPAEIVKQILGHIITEDRFVSGQRSGGRGHQSTKSALLQTCKEFNEHASEIMYKERSLNVEVSYTAGKTISYSKLYRRVPWSRCRNIKIHLKPNFKWDSRDDARSQTEKLDRATETQLKRFDDLIGYFEDQKELQQNLDAERTRIEVIFYESDGTVLDGRLAKGTVDPTLPPVMPFWTFYSIAEILISYRLLRIPKTLNMQSVFQFPTIASAITQLGDMGDSEFLDAWEKSPEAFFLSLAIPDDSARSLNGYCSWLIRPDLRDCYHIHGLNTYGSMLVRKALLPVDVAIRQDALESLPALESTEKYRLSPVVQEACATLSKGLREGALCSQDLDRLIEEMEGLKIRCAGHKNRASKKKGKQMIARLKQHRQATSAAGTSKNQIMTQCPTSVAMTNRLR